jgi:cell division protein YceG involved in septum cleavage
MKEKNLQQNYEKITEILNVLIVVIFIFTIGYLVYKVYKISKYQPIVTSTNIQLNINDTSKKIESTIQFANPVSSNEPTGRPDPMAPY